MHEAGARAWHECDAKVMGPPHLVKHAVVCLEALHWHKVAPKEEHRDETANIAHAYDSETAYRS